MPVEEKPPYASLGYKPNSEPNKSIVIISEIEGLAEQISSCLHKLSRIKDLPLNKAVATANTWAKLDGLRTKEIHELRKAFE